MEVKFKSNKITVVVKTTTLDKEGNPTFGKRTYKDMKELVNIAEKAVFFNAGANVKSAHLATAVYLAFKKEHLIPLVYAEVDGMRYSGGSLIEV